LDFKGVTKEKATVGQYVAEFDYDYSNADAMTMTVNLSGVNPVKGAPNAKKNALLAGSFNPEMVKQEGSLAQNINGTILEFANNKLLFYQTNPVKLEVSLPAGETMFSYNLAQPSAFVLPNKLINWYSGTTVKGPGVQRMNAGYLVPLQKSTSTQQIKGMYYYPQNGVLNILQGTVAGGRVSATALVINPGASVSADIKVQRQDSSTLQLGINPKDDVTMDKVRDAVKNEDACATQDTTIVWNEAKLIQ